MMDLLGKASNMLSVLMNRDVVERVEVIVNSKQQPIKIIAILTDKEKKNAEIIKKMFVHDLGCGYGCPTTGIDADVENGKVTIDRNAIHDKETYDLLIQAMIQLANLLY